MKRTALLAAWLVIGLAGLTAQTKTVDVLKDESTITYRINHTLHHIEATSKDGWFRVDIDPDKKEIKSVSAEVDVMTFDSGNSNRDSHAMEVIESIKYPDVTFVSSSVTQNADSIFVHGKLTFHGVTNDIVMSGVATWAEHKLSVDGAFELSLTAFKVERPALLMVPVDDALKFSLKAAFPL
ncbi:MAG TPA: YceI family protein [Bacteroidota bacterium]|nr:YceI family protein [Bacteroidota bacterium]